MKKNKKIVIAVMPAYNAARTLEKTCRDIPKGVVDDCIVVDDDSQDETVKKAKELGLKVFINPKNMGYGANQKVCYEKALSMKADIVVMIHPDYQYDSSLTYELVEPIIAGKYDLMLGSRIRTRREALEGGMPLYKYIANRSLTLLENLVLGANLSEYHTGFRAYSKELLNTVPFGKFSNDFVFDQQMIISAFHSRFRVGEIPVPVRYFKDASSINFSRSVIYGLGILFNLLIYSLHEGKVIKSNIFSKK